MNTSTPTPAQDYMRRIINALTEMIDNPGDANAAEDVLASILERPKTLRSALSAALYKSQSERLTRQLSHMRW